MIALPTFVSSHSRAPCGDGVAAAWAHVESVGRWCGLEGAGIDFRARWDALPAHRRYAMRLAISRYKRECAERESRHYANLADG